jgi:outer membrane autotransporter protein
VTQSDYESQSTQDEGESMSWQGYVYAGWADQPENGGLKISGALGAGQTELEAERDIALSPGMAKSSHDGTIISAALQGGYEIRAGKWTLTPAMGLGYVQLKEDGFCESKAGPAGLQISSRKDHSLQSFAGGSVERQFCLMGMIIKPELRLRWQHEFYHDSKAIKARLAGGGDYFKTPGRDLSSDSLVAGLSVKTSISESAFCSFDYDLNLQNSNGYKGHVLALQLGFMF